MIISSILKTEKNSHGQAACFPSASHNNSIVPTCFWVSFSKYRSLILKAKYPDFVLEEDLIAFQMLEFFFFYICSNIVFFFLLTERGWWLKMWSRDKFTCITYLN